jgi:serpin B
MFLPLLLAVFVLASCNINNAGNDDALPEPYKFVLIPQAAEVIHENNRFGVEFYLEAASSDLQTNLMLSPLSASAALTMLLNGAGGTTYSQVRDMLGYPNHLKIGDINKVYRDLVRQLLQADPKVKLSLANSMFYDHMFHVRPDFKAALKAEFDALVQELDFSDPKSVNVINQWASDNTNGLIDQVLEDLHPDLVMVLMNAIYYKGSWTSEFDEKSTRPRSFTFADGSRSDVPTMSGEVAVRYTYGEGYTAVELPYGRRNFSMVIVIPETHEFQEFMQEFSADEWLQLTKRLGKTNEWTAADVYLPKFSYRTQSFFLNETLQRLGMLDAFQSRVADFSAISDTPIFVGFVKQDSFIDVNEEGTEAAAVTTIGFFVDSIGSPPGKPSFYVNRPFLYGIREQTTNTLLFMGHVVDPTK